MLVAVAVASVVIGFVVGAGVIGRQVARLGRQRTEPVWRLADATGYVAPRLGHDTTAVLQPAQLSELLRLHVNLLQYGPVDPTEGGPAVALDRDGVAAQLYLAARNDGHEITKPMIDDVVDTHSQFLFEIGALAPVDGAAQQQ